jgi:transglutaminase-like putative cysteine protease
MARSRLKLEEGWASFLLLALMLLSVVWSVRAADWTEGLGILQWVAILAMALALFLGKSRRIPAIVSHLLLLIVGAIWITVMLTLVFAPPLVPAGLVAPGSDLLARARVMYQQMLSWVLDPSGAEVWLSNFMFVSLLAALTWLLCYWSTWFILRSHWVWGAVVPAGAACLLNIYYGPQRLVVYFILYLLCALLLIVRIHVYLRQSAWRKAGVNYNIDVDFAFLRDGLLISMLALFLAWTMPVAARSSRVADIWAHFQDPWQEMQAGWNRLFTSLNYQGPSTLVQFGRAMTLGGAVNLSNTPILQVQAAEPHYWRAVAYDRYTGSGWLDADELQVTLQPDDPRLTPVPYTAQHEFTHTIRVLEAGQDIVFFAGEPLRSTLFVRARLTSVPLAQGQPPSAGGERQATAVSMLESLRSLRRNQSYTVVSLVSGATTQQLRNAGTDYPDWVRDRYLQLPRTVPERVRALAREVVRGATTPYDQAAAIQEYLRRITYDQYINAPPAGRDVVDWFLFENRRGYCDYYASAMAVMCRILGIPARISQGYTPGEYDSASRSYVVRQLDAHAWPELYFPGYGWIDFEPTSSEPELARPDDGTSPLGPGMGLSTPVPREQDEDKFGPDDVGAGEDIANADVAPRQPWYRPLLYPALALLGAGVIALLLLFAWWYASLRGLSAAASIYEQMRRLGGLLGVTHQTYQTPAEYGESLSQALSQSQEDVRYVVAQYVKQRFSKHGLSAAEKEQLQERWRRLRWLMWRQSLKPRLKRRARPAPWVPASALRPPTALG